MPTAGKNPRGLTRIVEIPLKTAQTGSLWRVVGRARLLAMVSFMEEREQGTLHFHEILFFPKDKKKGVH
jgi:hypothetical protein